MSLLYLEKLKDQLARRAKAVTNSNPPYLQGQLRIYFQQLENNPVFSDIIKNLRQKDYLLVPDWLAYYKKERTPHVPHDVDSQAAQWLVILEAVLAGTQHGFTAFVNEGGGSLSEMKRDFVNNIFDPFNSYIEEQLDTSNFNESILQRYKLGCEWYRREELRKKIEDEEALVKAGKKKIKELEKVLTNDAVNFLFLNGVTPLSMTLGNCKPDMLANLFAFNQLVTEIKIFKEESDRDGLESGYRQLSEALSTTGHTTGFLIVFNIGKSHLEIVNDIKDRSMIVIVINATEVSASELKGTTRLNASDLIKNA